MNVFLDYIKKPIPWDTNRFLNCDFINALRVGNWDWEIKCPGGNEVEITLNCSLHFAFRSSMQIVRYDRWYLAMEIEISISDLWWVKPWIKLHHWFLKQISFFNEFNGDNVENKINFPKLNSHRLIFSHSTAESFNI